MAARRPRAKLPGGSGRPPSILALVGRPSTLPFRQPAASVEDTAGYPGLQRIVGRPNGLSWIRKDGVAYAIDLDLNNPKLQRLSRLANLVHRKHPEFKVRSADIKDVDNELDRIVYLQNEGLKHMPEHVPYTRRDIETMIAPLIDLADMDLVLFAEVNGQPAGFFPGVPNFNEIVQHLNGLRYPWDYWRYLKYRNTKPKCIAIKSVVVPPEYWDTGVAIIMFDEMVKRATARGYQWADLSLTGENNTDTRPLALHAGARVYKRYRFYKKDLA